MAAHHSVSRWFCSTCSFDLDSKGEILFTTESDYETHMVENHSDAFTSRDLPLLVELAERNTIEPISCPLCVNDHNSVLVDHDDHIAKHLHSFSLRALPWDFDLDEAAASAGSSDSPPPPGPQPLQDEDSDDESDDESEVDVEDVKKAVRCVRMTFEHLRSPGQADSLERLKGHLELDMSLLLLAELEGWVTFVSSTESQKQTCALLLGRVQDSLGRLATEDLSDSTRMLDLGSNIALDLQALKECIHQGSRQDHDLWQESFQMLSGETRARVQAMTARHEVDYPQLSLPERLEKLLKLSWKLEERCRRAALTTEHEKAKDIVSSLQLLADDESIFLSPPTTLPWVVLLETMKVCANSSRLRC